MVCEKIQKNVTGFLKGSLSRSEEEKVFQHLNTCVKCRLVYQDIRQRMHEESDNSGSSNSERPAP